MGHVPPGPVPRKGAGPHLPRRQRREAGEDGAQALTDVRRIVGERGEDIAAWWLSGQGLRIVDRNIELGGGELDLVARDGKQTVVIEVRASTGDGDPIDAIDDDKRRRVRRLAAAVGAGRVDLVGVGLGPDALIVHWVPG